ncbi:MAG: hypothetical protein P8M30_19855 [Planctomycetaceae bacterium]|nr:hypothetical protein [Planctomycetaceae bacterium]MDG2391568.1 hypothetical protein [Planctomycetaceae bacterium]
MNLSILKAFITDQRQAKSIVNAKLNIPEDITAMDWAESYCNIRDAYNSAPFAEIFMPHGYGLEIKIGDLYIDYDYSKTGRADGFDDWRIFVFMMAGQFDNNGPDKHIADRVYEWFRELVESKYLVKKDNLYYINS